MSTHTFEQSAQTRRQRWLSAGSALAVSFTLLGVLVTHFHRSAETHWLAATPAIYAALAQCDEAHAAAAERQRCRETLLQGRLPIEARWVSLAPR